MITTGFLRFNFGVSPSANTSQSLIPRYLLTPLRLQTSQLPEAGGCLRLSSYSCVLSSVIGNQCSNFIGTPNPDCFGCTTRYHMHNSAKQNQFDNISHQLDLNAKSIYLIRAQFLMELQNQSTYILKCSFLLLYDKFS